LSQLVEDLILLSVQLQRNINERRRPLRVWSTLLQLRKEARALTWVKEGPLAQNNGARTKRAPGLHCRLDWDHGLHRCLRFDHPRAGKDSSGRLAF